MQILSNWWSNIQAYLFPLLEEELDFLTEKQQQLISILEILRIEDFIPNSFGYRGRPPKNRKTIARSFVAKAVYNMPTTRILLDRLKSDIALRRICGWERKNEIPDEATFSRAFVEFSKLGLGQIVHDSLIKKVFKK